MGDRNRVWRRGSEVILLRGRRKPPAQVSAHSSETDVCAVLNRICSVPGSLLLRQDNRDCREARAAPGPDSRRFTGARVKWGKGGDRGLKKKISGPLATFSSWDSPCFEGAAFFQCTVPCRAAEFAVSSRRLRNSKVLIPWLENWETEVFTHLFFFFFKRRKSQIT